DFLKTRQKNELPDFAAGLEEIRELEKHYATYTSKADLKNIDAANQSQQQLAEHFQPFFATIHEMLKVIDKKVRKFEKEHGSNKEGKSVKTELDELHKDIKDSEYFFTHINWLHERFPEAKYEDVTGLCKLAAPDEVKEQDYSLNSGRYVGVVIEEDGKTEEEFVEEIVRLNEELKNLNAEASNLEKLIDYNINQIAEVE
ncbi:MAG: N-6 DNA methylase, partial [Candidatus Omnitrophota bacterium]|nr:N-6 DNA methylase [Candidatus Omnitrophota bacterium]